MLGIFLLGIAISVVLATCITILMNKSKKYILYITIILISIGIVQGLSIIDSDNYLFFLILSELSPLLILLIAYIIIIDINKNNIVKKLKNELNKEYNEFSVKALFKKEVISGNEIDVGAIRHYYDFIIDLEEYNCKVIIYRIQELCRIYDRRHHYYKYKTLETIIEYRYDLNNIYDAYNKINYLAVDYFNSKENIKVSFDGDNLIVKKSINQNQYNESYITDDVQSIRKYYEKLIGDVL